MTQEPVGKAFLVTAKLFLNIFQENHPFRLLPRLHPISNERRNRSFKIVKVNRVPATQLFPRGYTRFLVRTGGENWR